VRVSDSLKGEPDSSGHDRLARWLAETWLNVIGTLGPNAFTKEEMKNASYKREEWLHPEYKKQCCLDGLARWRMTRMIDNANGYSEQHAMIFEIKPQIDSDSEVLRQIKLYRDTFRGLNRETKIHCCLYTLDNKYDRFFTAEGIYVYHPDPDNDALIAASELSLPLPGSILPKTHDRLW